MNYEAFKYCLKILGHWDDPKGKIIAELTFGEGNFIKRFVDPFRTELGENLIASKDIEDKKELFRHYIHEINRTINIVRFYENLGISDVADEDLELIFNTLLLISTKIEITSFLLIHYLYGLLFTEIQLLCRNKKISFSELCSEVDFPLNTININIIKENERYIMGFLINDSIGSQISQETTLLPIKGLEIECQIPQGIPPPPPPIRNFEKELCEIGASENKFWKGLPMEVVIEHFNIMTARENANGNVYLTKEQLISFLRKGFLNDETQPRQKINYSKNEKGFVIKRFYELFDLANREYDFPNKKASFINQIFECFDNNWTHTSIVSLFRPNIVDGKWE